ncbi:uncharacterized protein EDB91DRAFT_390670 [Suillus paluster]|uniref:uncharacterized protein n=1 Tax=Suillus paluster TaxID=48578 RepID=UPI001B87B754|nr:uncharacterized protein EDB91DRAFT_390670 [Suillus paluster]KAG1739092.1 hypothetical protein EDB91DRAFT_390670 [Suillus paluster]
MSKVFTVSGGTPTPLPRQSAWAKGPPQRSSSSAVPSPRSQSPAPNHVASLITTSHSRRPSALCQGVSVKDGVSVPRNSLGSVRPGSVVFASTDDAWAPVSSSSAAIPAVKTEVVKYFGSVPATSSKCVNGKTPAFTSTTGSSKPARPALSSTPSNSTTPPSTSTASTPKPSKADIAKLFQNPSSSSPHPHQAPHGGVAPMQRMQCGGYYYMDPYQQRPPSTASTPKPTKADIAKLFRNPSSSSQPPSDMASPSTRHSNLPPHHQSSSSSQPPPQPSQLGAHSFTPFVPGMRQSQQPAGTPRSPAFPRAVPNMQAQSRPGPGPGGPGGPNIPASPRMAPHPHQAPPGGVAPIQPMQWGGYYYMDPYQQQPPWGYYAMPSQHMHQQSHQQHVPHADPPHQPGTPLPMSPRSAIPQLPGTPTMVHAVPHPPHTPQSPPSVSSPPPTPSTANAPRLNTNASAFVPLGRPSAKVTIKSQDGMEVTLDALKKHSPQPPLVPIAPASPVVSSRRIRSVSVRIESEDSKRLREETARGEDVRPSLQGYLFDGTQDSVHHDSFSEESHHTNIDEVLHLQQRKAKFNLSSRHQSRRSCCS